MGCAYPCDGVLVPSHASLPMPTSFRNRERIPAISPARKEIPSSAPSQVMFVAGTFNFAIVSRGNGDLYTAIEDIAMDTAQHPESPLSTPPSLSPSARRREASSDIATITGESTLQAGHQAPRPPLGTLLIKEGLITAAQLQEALQQQANLPTYLPLGHILVDNKIISATLLRAFLAKHRNAPALAKSCSRCARSPRTNWRAPSIIKKPTACHSGTC